jgi:hypothetical protein
MACVVAASSDANSSHLVQVATLPPLPQAHLRYGGHEAHEAAVGSVLPLSWKEANVEAVNAIAYATRYHSDWFWKGAQHMRKWSGVARTLPARWRQCNFAEARWGKAPISESFRATSSQP